MFVLPDWLARVWFGMLRQGGLPAAFAGKSCQQPMLFVLCVINSSPTFHLRQQCVPICGIGIFCAVYPSTRPVGTACAPLCDGYRRSGAVAACCNCLASTSLYTCGVEQPNQNPCFWCSLLGQLKNGWARLGASSLLVSSTHFEANMIPCRC